MAEPQGLFDAVVIGAGHNGLAAGATLARAGMSVCVLERGERLGGAASTETRADGTLFSCEAYAGRLVDPSILRSLDLARYGLRILPTYAAYGIAPGAQAIGIYSHPVKTERALAARSARAAERFRELVAMVQRQQLIEAPLREALLPDPVTARRGGGVASAFHDLQELGAATAYELSYFWTASLGDVLDDFLDMEPLKAMLALRVLAGVPLGPFGSGTASRLLHNPLLTRNPGGRGVGGYVAGGAGALAEALADSLRAAGSEVRFKAAVSAILLENGRAAGVVLENGTEVRGKTVLSSLDVKQTFLTLFQSDALPQPFLGRVAQVQSRGCAAKLDLALSSLPDFPGLPADWIDTPGDILVCADLKSLERAYHDWASGNMPETLPMLISVPSLLDRRRALGGRHVMSVLVQSVPETLADGAWTPERRGTFTTAVFRRLEAVSPGLVNRITDMRVLLPGDMDTEIGIAGGSLFHSDDLPGKRLHGQPAVDAARYATPIPNLFLCGAGAYPGGGLTAAPGALSARAVIAEARKGGRRW